MLESRLDELTSIEQLIYKCNFKQALEKLVNFEKKKDNSSNQHLLALILKGKTYVYSERYKKAVEIGKIAYNLSKKSRNITGTANALLLRASIIFSGKLDDAYNYIMEAENLIDNRLNKPSSKLNVLQGDLILIKSIIYRISNDINKALELALKWLKLHEQTDKKLDLARVYWQLGEIFLYKSEPNKALDYAKKSLIIQKKLNNKVGIATSLNLVGLSYYSKGNFLQALKFCKQSLMIKEISVRTKLDALHNLGAIYKENGAINRTMRYYTRAVKLAEKEDYTENYIINILGIGAIYRMKGEHDKAIENFTRSLLLSKKIKSLYGMSSSLFYLILINIDLNTHKQAQIYLSQLDELTTQTGSYIFKQVYIIAKALILKKSGRIRNYAEAEMLLKQVTEKEIAAPQLYLLSFVNLCELFLEELSLTNSMDALDELNSLIMSVSKVAENQNAYLWLTEIKLLQAKLALIQMNITDAEQLLTHAQQIAEIHGLNFLAVKISSEHDKLLDHLNTWENLGKQNAPLVERIKLAHFESVINRMQGRSIIKPPKLVHEIPVLLLIIGEGGFPLFSIVFSEEWPFKNDLISGFLSAFDSFSGVIFAKRLDRAKFGDYTLLMQSINKFSFCYFFKGQSYLAKLKLNRFMIRIKNADQMWDMINKYYKANRVMELKDHPLLESIINDIFIKRLPGIKL
ncbi:MAG: tetratricopeptide repeat protein [Candidatus Hermodarchaeota archaeon]